MEDQDQVFTPMQNAILKAVFKQMDEELGIRPLTYEQIKAFNIKLNDLADDEDYE
jgi:hypothetical protein